ncbi:MAG: GxxExxY protein [bacterium]|nr:GxxExxY protein [bacterium]
MKENEISGKVVEAAIEVHRTLGGPGLLESAYEEALVFELGLMGLEVDRQKAVPVIYKGTRLNTNLRLDLLVENKVVVECKATREGHQIFAVQALTYLRLLDLKLALVVNFGKPLLKDGIHRIVNDL